MKEELRISVSPDGETTVEVNGMRGPACLRATRAIEQAIGSVAERRKKKEYYDQEGRTGNRGRREAR